MTERGAARSIHAHMTDTVLIGAVSLFAWIGTIVVAMWALVTLNRIHTHLKAVRTQLDRVERAITQHSCSDPRRSAGGSPSSLSGR